MTVMNLDKLEVWVRAKGFSVAIYKEVLPHLPAEEKWNLGQQLRRAAQSIPANIAEGHGRYHSLDNVRFCYIARGSLTEVQSHIALAHELGYLPADIYSRISSNAESLGRQLNNYIAYLKRSKQGGNEPTSSHAVHEESESYLPDYPPETEPNH